MQKVMLLVAGVVIVAAGYLYLASGKDEQTPAEQIQQSKEQIFTVQVTKQKLRPEIVTVTQGDTVVMHVMSDESGEFHISGYEIENDMTAGSELSFSFTADKAGRYNFELHLEAEGTDEDHDAATTGDDAGTGETEDDIVIGAFVVNPR